MSSIFHIENAGRAYRPPEDFNSALCGLLWQGLGVHRSHDTQENLVMLDILALRDSVQQEKLAGMSIHTEITRRRKALGWSMERLAAEVSKVEGLKKPLNWQTVQQWENGGSAPKRTRMGFVAQAFGCSLAALMTDDADILLESEGASARVVKASALPVTVVAKKAAKKEAKPPPSKMVPPATKAAPKKTKRGLE